MFPVIDLGILERYRVWTTDGTRKLAEIDPKDKALPFAKDADARMADDLAEVERLQEVLYAQAKHALLVVFQGMDASGKNSTVKRVFGGLDPLGIVAANFRKPTEDELSHDFLWRIHKVVPPAGMIGIFNRSHYEDVLVVRVQGLLPPDRIEARYAQINAFERHLAENGVTILKFFMHISKEEQKTRLQARLADATKRWKLKPDDLAGHERWNDYMIAYQIALERCSTEWAPWFIVPANHKWTATQSSRASFGPRLKRWT
jgi:PPK2 family polyphosphate:nucleotide phosphotransferase